MAYDNDMDMDLTNLNSTESQLSEIELLRLELKKEEEITKELESKLKNSESFSWKSKYESKMAEIEKLSLELDNLKGKYPDHSEMDEQLELLNLQKKTDELVANSEETIKNLEAKLSDCINSEQLEPECSNFNILDNDDLIEENIYLKNKYTASCERLDGLETKKIKLADEILSLETEVLELKKSSLELKQAAAVTKEAYEEKLGEKALLLATMNQSKPLSELNGKDSLFDDALNGYKLVSNNYKTLKDQHVKAKEMLAKNNAEIKRLTAEQINQKRICSEILNEKSNAAEELNNNQLERIKDLKKSIEKLKILKEEIEGKKTLQEISYENRFEVERFVQMLEDEERQIQHELRNMLSSKITLQLKLSKCDRELQSHKKLLSTKTDANIELQNQLKQLQDCIQDKEAGKENRVKTPPEVNMKKSVRFSQKINFLEESKDN